MSTATMQSPSSHSSQSPTYRQSGAGNESHNEPQRHSEGSIARMIEEQTAQIPSDVFLWSAGVAIAGSLALKIMGRDHEANFVGHWAPTILLLGVYNKLVKVAGSDRSSGQRF